MSYLIAPKAGVSVDRRADCARLYPCEDAWIDALTRTKQPIGTQAACPRKRSSFVRLGLRESVTAGAGGRVVLGDG